MENKKTQGGARKGAGRKSSADPKKAITIYVEQSIIDGNNGVDEVKRECYLFLKNRSEENISK